MGKRKRMADRYRHFSFLSDIEGMKNAIGEMHGKFFPRQPVLNNDDRVSDPDRLLDEEWFIQTIKDNIASHPENSMEYPFFGEPIFEEPLAGFVRGNDPIFDRFKEVIGPQSSKGSSQSDGFLTAFGSGKQL
jgi:epoxyqueuosine reductase